jgi:hypothetical protein
VPISAFSVPDVENPPQTYVLALGDGGEVDFNLGLGEHVGGRSHVDEEIWESGLLAGCFLPSNHRANPSANRPIGLQSPHSSLISHSNASHSSRTWFRGQFTLHSRLGAQTGQRAHGAHHEVLEDAGPRLVAGLIPVRGEGGDLCGFGVALEGGVERGGRLVAGL